MILFGIQKRDGDDERTLFKKSGGTLRTFSQYFLFSKSLFASLAVNWRLHCCAAHLYDEKYVPKIVSHLLHKQNAPIATNNNNSKLS